MCPTLPRNGGRMTDLDTFREETRDWLAANCPPGARGPGEIPWGSTKAPIKDPDTALWLERMAERGWTVPTWPTEFGGGGLSKELAAVLVDEMRAINARAPLGGRGISYIGPTLLEMGTQDQKERFLPGIVRGEGYWSQGYSEPGAGSDLAGLSTRAVLEGDHFIVNGQKIWTSGAMIADWIFVLTRSLPDAPKHEGITFLIMTMDQPGIRVRPIKLISGVSPFCEVFFEDAIAEKRDMVGARNEGWTVGKRLLQHERSTHGGLTGNMSGATTKITALADTARKYLGETAGQIADHDRRHQIARMEMNDRAFRLSQRRAGEEARELNAPGAVTSIFKYYTGMLTKERAELARDLMGTAGFGWDGDGFTEAELGATRNWLTQRSSTIHGGTREIQLNIIAKRVLGLPD